MARTRDAEIRFRWTRVDVRVYASRPDEAMRIFEVLARTLEPEHGVPRGWTRNGCRVVGCDLDTGPFDSEEPDTKWPVVLAGYSVEWGEDTSAINSEGT